MNTKTRLVLAASGMAMIAASVPASAQDVVVMRRVIAAPLKKPGATTPTPSPTSPTPAPSPTSPTPSPTSPSPSPNPSTPTPAPTPVPTPAPTPAPAPVFSYGWSQAVGPWSSTCSKNATRTNVVACRRSDGATVTEDHCVTADRPSATDTRDVSSSCTYAPTYGNPSVCTSNTPGSTTGSQTLGVTSCLRSDNTDADVSMCSPATKVQACRPDNTSDQYSRLPANLIDTTLASGQNDAYRLQSNPITGSTYRFSTQSTVCWDSVNNKTVAASFCSALAYGANVFDLVAVPATYVPDLREFYVAQADITAANIRGGPYGVATGGYTTPSAICSINGSGAAFTVNTGSAIATWTMHCGPADSPAHYQRQARYVGDPSTVGALPVATRTINAITRSTYSFTVFGTHCWDSTAKTVVSSNKCAYLPTGTNVYDMANVPATFVPDLREVYVSRADVQATMPAGSTVVSAYSQNNDISTLCNGLGMAVNVGGATQVWSMRCGTPDSSAHYQRQASYVGDPFAIGALPVATRTINANTKSTFTLAALGTLCWDSTAKTTASAAKCSYLSTGANVYDLAAVPASYVTDLREVYVARADVQATMPNGSSVGNYNGTNIAISDFCTNGNIAAVNVGGATQVWTIKCGTPDNSAHYQRQVSYVGDPFAVGALPVATRTINANTKSTFTLAALGTQCWDSTAKTVAAAAKCAYLSTGANVYDLAAVNASYVTDLREVYVARADVQAVMPNGSSVGNYNGTNIALSDVCTNGTIAAVAVGGVTQVWTIKCGTPDSPLHYQRQASAIADPMSMSALPAASRTLNANTKSTFTFGVYGTFCWDSTAKAGAPTAKCAYLPSGTNTNDLATVSATYVTDLREVYVTQSEVQATMPNGSSVYNYNGTPSSLASTCSNGSAVMVQVGGAAQPWTMRCGTADTADHYEKRTTLISDPYALTALTTAARNVNVPTASTLTFGVKTATCWDTTANAIAATFKCQYTSTGSTVNDLLSVPATYVSDTREVYVQQADLQALMISGSSVADRNGTGYSLTNACNAGLPFNMTVGGAAQVWTMRCGAPDTATYTRFAQRMIDPGVYGSTAAIKATNSTANATLSVQVDSPIGCWNLTAGAAASASTKCSNVSRGPTTGSILSVPATWNTATTTVTITKADLLATGPYVPATAFTGSQGVCSGNKWQVGGVAYTVVCK